MKIRAITLGLVSAATIAAASTAAAAVGGQTSGEIVVRGKVGDICEIAVVDLGTVLNLLDGERDTAVGRIKETCNDPNGYTISFESANGGKMIGPLDAESEYTVNYDSVAGEKLKKELRLDRSEPRWNAEYDLTVDVEGQFELPAGEYKDLVVVNISAQ